MKAGCFKFMKGLVGGDPPYPPFKKGLKYVKNNIFVVVDK